MNMKILSRSILSAGTLLAASSVMAATPTAAFDVLVRYDTVCGESESDSNECMVVGEIQIYGVFPSNTGINIGGALVIEPEDCRYDKQYAIPGHTAYATLTCLLPPSDLEDEGEHLWYPYDMKCGDAWTPIISLVEYTKHGPRDRAFKNEIGQRGAPQVYSTISATMLGQECQVNSDF